MKRIDQKWLIYLPTITPSIIHLLWSMILSNRISVNESHNQSQCHRQRWFNNLYSLCRNRNSHQRCAKFTKTYPARTLCLTFCHSIWCSVSASHCEWHYCCNDVCSGVEWSTWNWYRMHRWPMIIPSDDVAAASAYSIDNDWNADGTHPTHSIMPPDWRTNSGS